MGVRFGSRARNGKGGGPGSRLFLTVFGFFFGSMGLAFLLFGLSSVRQHFQMRAWTPTRCVIQSSEVTDKGEDYQLVVRYRYDYAGRSYDGTRFGTSGADRFSSVAKRQRLLTAYAPDTETRCFVDPDNPADAVLVRDGSLAGPLFASFFALPFVLIGYGLVVGAWWKRKAGSSAPALSDGAVGEKNGRRIGSLLGLVFLAIGLVVPYFTFVRPLQRQHAARQWTPVEAVVTKSMVKSHRGDDSTTYSVYIAYRYTLDGRTYEGDRYTFLSGSSSGYEGKAAVVRQHPSGSKLTVYANPADPLDSVVRRDMGPALFLGLIPVVFAVVGAIFLVALRRGTLASSPSFPQDRQRHAATVKRSGTRFGQFVGILFFALFWNGIVSVFVYQTVKEWRGGHHPVFQTLFLVPFVAVGLATVGFAFHALLKLFNPRVLLDPPDTPLALGGKAPMRFRILGNVHRLSQLTVTLTGREEVTYRQGTSTSTDRHEFWNDVLFETQDPRRMVAGEVAVSIPANAMHSFTAPNNKIVWALKVQGRIPLWPDVSDEYILNVLPQEQPS